MTEREGTTKSSKTETPSIAEMINTGMSSVSELVASYTRAVQAEEKKIKSPKDRETEGRVSDKSA